MFRVFLLCEFTSLQQYFMGYIMNLMVFNIFQSVYLCIRLWNDPKKVVTSENNRRRLEKKQQSSLVRERKGFGRVVWFGALSALGQRRPTHIIIYICTLWYLNNGNDMEFAAWGERGKFYASFLRISNKICSLFILQHRLRLPWLRNAIKWLRILRVEYFYYRIRFLYTKWRLISISLSDDVLEHFPYCFRSKKSIWSNTIFHATSNKFLRQEPFETS